MITEIERKELRELFQGYYASDILKILKNKKITNRKASHTPSSMCEWCFKVYVTIQI